jgi:predicted lipoprotein with Yx(FWY)xxD motif
MFRHQFRITRWALPLVAAALLAAGCGSSSPTPASGGSSTSGGSGTVHLRSTPVGKVLTNAAGRTLYALTGNTVGHLICTGGCLSVWPPVTASGTPSAGSGVTASLGTTHFSGGTQLTVDGVPVYLYSGDSSAGTANGQGIKSFGGTWWVLGANGKPITSMAPGASPSSSSSSSGGGGYGY